MLIQIICLLVAVVLPLLWAIATLPHRKRQFGRVDMSEPRLQGAQLTGAGARAWGAQMNAWEALLVFVAANVAALAAGVEPTGNWSLAAPVWVAARLFHGLAYLIGLPVLRVVCFVASLGMSLWIFSMAFRVI